MVRAHLRYNHIPPLERWSLALTVLILLGSGGGCVLGEHPDSHYVLNKSKESIKVEITGLPDPWISKVIRPGGKEEISGCFANAAGSKIHEVIYSATTGKVLMEQDLDSELVQCGVNSAERIITYPPSSEMSH